MPFKYEINGSAVEFDQEPSEADIDEAAASLGPRKQSVYQLPDTKSFYDKAGASFTPEQQVQHPYLAAINKTGQDVATVGSHFANQLYLNHLRSLLTEHGIAFPQAQSMPAKIAAPVAGVAGAIESPVGKLAGGVNTAVKGAGLGLKALAGMTTGAVGGAAYAPSDSPGNVDERVKQGAIGAALGGAVPVVGAGASAIGSGIKKGMEYLGKSAADYVTTKVAPRAYQVYQDAVNKFTPQIQKFAEEKLNIPKSAIETIKNNGVQKIQQVRRTLGDTTDSIVQRLNDQIQDFRTAANYANNKVFQKAPTGQAINIKPSIDRAGNILKKLRLISADGNPTQFGESEIARDSVYGKLLDFYKSSKAISGVENIDSRTQNLTQGQMIKSVMSKRETLVNKEQFQLLRDKLNSLYKGKSSDVAVGKVVNQFYTDGESSGLSGLQKARELQRKAYDIEDNYAKLVKQGSFDKFHSLPQEQIRQLKELQGKLGVPFIEDLKALSAGKYLDKLAEYNPERFAKDFNTANDPKWTKTIYEEYKSLLGESHAKKIFDEIVAHRRGMKIKGGIMTGVGVGTAGAIGTGIVNKITGH